MDDDKTILQYLSCAEKENDFSLLGTYITFTCAGKFFYLNFPITDSASLLSPTHMMAEKITRS